jgi:hypothetical protein
MDCHGGALDEFYRRYRDGIITERELEAVVFERILGGWDNRYGLCFGTRGECADFLCWVYPKMRNVVRRYDEALASFDTYVASTLRYSYQTYRNRRKRRAVMERACWKAACGGAEAGVLEPEAVYGEEGTPARPCRITSPKYALLVLLKSYYHVSESLINKAAPALGMEPAVLGGMIDRLRGMHLKKITKLKNLTRSAHGLYFRCLGYESQLADRHKDARKLALLSLRLARGRARLARMRERLRLARVEATNSSLAELLGIPKGTVDSRLALIKCKMAGGKLTF